jgi:hypothetical protein
MILSAAFVFLSTLSTTYAAIGPIGMFPIVNAHIAPDGFQRSCIHSCVRHKNPFTNPLIL